MTETKDEWRTEQKLKRNNFNNEKIINKTEKKTADDGKQSQGLSKEEWELSHLHLPRYRYVLVLLRPWDWHGNEHSTNET